MNEEELEKPKLIWKGSVGEALKTGRLTQEQVDKWNMEEEMGEDYMNGFEEGFQKGKLEQKKEELEFLINLDKGLTEMGTIIPHIKERIKQLQKEIGGNEK